MKRSLQISVGVLALILFASDVFAIAGVRRRTRRRTAVVVGSAAAASSASASSAQQQQTAAAQQQTADAQAQTAAAQQQTAEAQASAAATPAPAPMPAPAPAPAPAGVKLPMGSVTSALPAGCTSSAINGVEYYFDGANYYRAVFQGNTLVYVTAEPG